LAAFPREFSVKETVTDPTFGSIVLAYYRGLVDKLRSFLKPVKAINCTLRNRKNPIHPFDRQRAIYCLSCGIAIEI